MWKREKLIRGGFEARRRILVRPTCVARNWQVVTGNARQNISQSFTELLPLFKGVFIISRTLPVSCNAYVSLRAIKFFKNTQVFLSTGIYFFKQNFNSDCVLIIHMFHSKNWTVNSWWCLLVFYSIFNRRWIKKSFPSQLLCKQDFRVMLL